MGKRQSGRFSSRVLTIWYAGSMLPPPDLQGNIDGSVKRPISALRFIPRHCGVPISTPHSSGFASLDLGAFYETIRNEIFYRFIKGKGSGVGIPGSGLRWMRGLVDGFRRACLGVVCLVLLLAGTALAEEGAKPAAKKVDPIAKELSGMSIVGNDEAPKSLYIVPWKSSEIGVETSLSSMLNDKEMPVDREVFKRQLDFYQVSTAR